MYFYKRNWKSNGVVRYDPNNYDSEWCEDHHTWEIRQYHQQGYYSPDYSFLSWQRLMPILKSCQLWKYVRWNISYEGVYSYHNDTLLKVAKIYHDNKSLFNTSLMILDDSIKPCAIFQDDVYSAITPILSIGDTNVVSNKHLMYSDYAMRFIDLYSRNDQGNAIRATSHWKLVDKSDSGVLISHEYLRSLIPFKKGIIKVLCLRDKHQNRGYLEQVHPAIKTVKRAKEWMYNLPPRKWEWVEA